jgi:hypothetical protein
VSDVTETNAILDGGVDADSPPVSRTLRFTNESVDNDTSVVSDVTSNISLSASSLSSDPDSVSRTFLEQLTAAITSLTPKKQRKKRSVFKSESSSTSSSSFSVVDSVSAANDNETAHSDNVILSVNTKHSASVSTSSQQSTVNTDAVAVVPPDDDASLSSSSSSSISSPFIRRRGRVYRSTPSSARRSSFGSSRGRTHLSQVNRSPEPDSRRTLLRLGAGTLLICQLSHRERTQRALMNEVNKLDTTLNSALTDIDIARAHKKAEHILRVVNKINPADRLTYNHDNHVVEDDHDEEATGTIVSVVTKVMMIVITQVMSRSI